MSSQSVIILKNNSFINFLSRELRTLYEQYLESRTRYYFYKERLTKELKLQPPASTSTTLSIFNQPIHIGTIDLTKKSTLPNTPVSVNYSNQTALLYQQQPVVLSQHHQKPFSSNNLNMPLSQCVTFVLFFFTKKNIFVKYYNLNFIFISLQRDKLILLLKII